MAMARPENISYHIGDLSAGAGQRKSEGFHRMVQNMELGDLADGDFGFGIIGTGIYHAEDPRLAGMDEIGDGKHGYALDIDPGRYPMLRPENDEQAERLLAFLSRYQGYVIAHGAEGFHRWDDALKGVDMRSLYGSCRAAFGGRAKSPEEFAAITGGLVRMAKEAMAGGIDEDLHIIGLPEKYIHADSINTLFMKAHGIAGVDLRGTRYGTYEQGSVIFSLDERDILKEFPTKERMQRFHAEIERMRSIGAGPMWFQGRRPAPCGHGREEGQEREGAAAGGNRTGATRHRHSRDSRDGR